MVCSNCNSSGYITRSVTVGILNSRLPPSEFGIVTLRSELGWHMPSNACHTVSHQLSRQYQGLLDCLDVCPISWFIVSGLDGLI